MTPSLNSLTACLKTGRGCDGRPIISGVIKRYSASKQWITLGSWTDSVRLFLLKHYRPRSKSAGPESKANRCVKRAHACVQYHVKIGIARVYSLLSGIGAPYITN